MAHTCYSYTNGCWVVVVLISGKVIGRTHDYRQALQWAEDYNELHNNL